MAGDNDKYGTFAEGRGAGDGVGAPSGGRVRTATGALIGLAVLCFFVALGFSTNDYKYSPSVTVREEAVVSVDVDVEEPSTASTGDMSPQNAFSSVSLDDVTVSNVLYGQPDSMALYPWDFVMEPHRETTFALADSVAGDATVEWTLTNQADESETYSYTGASVSHTCTTAATLYTGTVKAESVSTSAKTTFTAVCKYVRRELRALTDDDRNAFFKALAPTYQYGQEEGQTLFGDRFYSSDTMGLKHLSYNYGYGNCTPFHLGPVFFTAHPGFSAEIEASVQMFDKAQALHYWDYSIDEGTYGYDWWDSPLWNDDWFSIGRAEDNYVITKGPFAYARVANEETEVSNAYNRVSDPFNMNKSPFVQRAAEICGLSTRRTTLPDCSYLSDALNLDTVSTLDDFETYIEGYWHTDVHFQVGGAFNCPYTFTEISAKYPQYEDMWTSLAVGIHMFWAQGYSSGYSVCPDTNSCDDDVAQEDCLCRSAEFDALMEELDSDLSALTESITCPLMAQYTDVRSAMVSYSDGYITTEYVEELDENCLRVSGASTEENDEIIAQLVAMASITPTLAQFYTAGPAPQDPIFAVSHNMYEKYFQFIRLNPEHNEKFDYSWVEDKTCYGRSWTDTLPWSNFFGDTRGVMYTNADLWDILDPASVHLPYIFDTFETGC